MSKTTMRTMTLIAGAAWLLIAGSELIHGLVDYGDSWEAPYILFTLALVVGVTLTIAMVARVTGESARPRLRMAGLAVSALGAVAAFAVAWALPLWMTLLGAGVGMVAFAADPAPRRPLALLAAGQLAGVATLIACIEAEVGRVDEYGDYPLAGGIAVVVVAMTAIVALIGLTLDRRTAMAAPAGA